MSVSKNIRVTQRSINILKELKKKTGIPVIILVEKIFDGEVIIKNKKK